MAALYLGLDFGTESVRALLTDDHGHIAAVAVAPYPHGQIVRGSEPAASLFGQSLPASFALQHPGDWLGAASVAVREALDSAGTSAVDVAGIGVDATSCTVLPTTLDGTPLCLARQELADRPHAWPKLWKHHGAVAQAERMTALATERHESWLGRYGGIVGLEWMFPKMLEVIEQDPEVAEATEVWIELGDWVTWQLTGGEPVRSTCQAGYKALWSPLDGYPCADYLVSVHPDLASIAEQKLLGSFGAPGTRAGELSGTSAELLGLSAGTPVSVAIIDAHAGVPGAGVGADGTLVMVLGTSGCHMIMSPGEHHIAGIAGVVADGILAGSFGYETGQAAVGDGFDWIRRMTGADDHDALERSARELPPGAEGLLAIDWFNGCRTPLMDGRLTGAILGIDLHHGPAHLYRSALEASACGLRWIVETLTGSGVAVDRYVATGGVATRSQLYVEILASVLGTPIEVNPLPHTPALGAAVFAAMAAGRFDSGTDAVASMAGRDSAVQPSTVVEPSMRDHRAYDVVYQRYRSAASMLVAAEAD